MGLLSAGKPLSPEETRAKAELVREHGLRQFLTLWRKFAQLRTPEFKWGDEIEYTLVHLDEAAHRTRAFLGADQMLPALQERELRLTHPHAAHEHQKEKERERAKLQQQILEKEAKKSGCRGCAGNGVEASATATTSSASMTTATSGASCMPCVECTCDAATRVRDEAEAEEELSRRASPVADCRLGKLCCEEPGPNELVSLWRPEYGTHMIEGTPAHPFGLATLHDILKVECNMRFRRREALQAAKLINPGLTVLTVSNFVRTGCPNYTEPPAVPQPAANGPGASQSVFYPDVAIHPAHPRFRTLTRNIRHRRGRKVAVLSPLYHDVKTKWPLEPADNLLFNGQLEFLAENLEAAGFGPSSKSSLNGLHNGISQEDLAFGEESMSLNNSRGSDDLTAAMKSTSISSSLSPQAAALLETFKRESWWRDVEAAAASNLVYMDAMGFGMGNCCLQVTMQAKDVDEARHLYDQLHAIAPLFLALTAVTPAHRGLLLDTDTRWHLICASVDDRDPVERGEVTPESAGGTDKTKATRFVGCDRPGHLSKSRYGTVSSYLSPPNSKYNDIPLERDPAVVERLVKAGIDQSMAEHVAHLFIRDTVSLFEEKLHQDDERDNDHFENIQSTNWQDMRFKPPPINNIAPDGSQIGWRVEFRPMEVGLTDFENAAFATFIVLLSRAILDFGLDFLLPLSRVDENFTRARRRDALRTERFFFRTRCFPPGYRNGFCSHSEASPSKAAVDANNLDGIHELTLNEIFNGNEALGFPGLVPIVRCYLQRYYLPNPSSAAAVTSERDATHELFDRIESSYLALVSRRASGELYTGARWIRGLIDAHPDYAHDSVIGESVAYDMTRSIDQLMRGEIWPKELFGDIRSPLCTQRLASSN